MEKNIPPIEDTDKICSEVESGFVERMAHLPVRDITPEDLRVVYAWSSTQRRKIDKCLRIKLKGIWKVEKQDENLFYATLLRMLSNDGSNRIYRLMEMLDKKQPRGKQGTTFSLFGRFYVRLIRIAKNIDAKKTDELCDYDEFPKDIFLNFLSKHGHDEFRIVYEHLLKTVESDEENDGDDNGDVMGDDLNCYCREMPWNSQKEDIKSIATTLGKLIRRLGLGMDVDEQEVDKKIAELRKKGKDLRESVLKIAGQYDFKKEPWNNWQEFDAYCGEIEELIARKNREQESLFQFFRGMAKVVSGIEVQHRSLRARSRFEKSLQNIVTELERQLERDRPAPLPGPQNPASWFDWAFGLSGKELEDIQDTLDPHYPELSGFIGDCHPDWLVFEKPAQDEESGDTGDTTDFTSDPNDTADIGATETEAPDLDPQKSESVPQGNDADLEELQEDNTALTASQRQQDFSVKDEEEMESSHKSDYAEDTKCLKRIQPKEKENSLSPSSLPGTNKTAGYSTRPDASHESSQVVYSPKDHFATYLKTGEFHKAYWLAISCDVGIPADLVGAVALGSQVGVGSSPPGQLQMFFSNLVTQDFGELGAKLLLFSAIAGSAVFTGPPSHEMYTLIEMVTSGIQPIDELAQYIRSEFIYKGTTIRPEDIDTALGSAGMEQQLQNLKEKSAEVLQRNNLADFIDYVPARIFLRHIYREGSDLTTIHHAIERNEEFRKKEINALLRRINVEELISSAHSLGLKGVAVPITGTARNQLMRRINETLALGRKWYGIVAGLAREGDKNEKKQVLVGLRQHLKRAIGSLECVPHRNVTSEVAMVPCQCFSRILESLDGKRSSTFKSLDDEIRPLDDEIISLEEIVLDDDFELAPESEKKILVCFGHDDKAATCSEQTFETLLGRKEFLRSARLIDKFQLEGKFRDRLGQRIEEEQNRIQNRIEHLLNRVEDAYLLGQLDHEDFYKHAEDKENKQSQEALRSHLIGRLEEILKRLRDINEGISWRVREIEATVDEIEAQLSRMEQRHNAELQTEFDKILNQFPDSEEGRQDREYVKEAFREAIDQGNNIAAVELFNRAREAIQSKSPLPRTTLNGNNELTSFLRKLEKYQEMLRAKGKLSSHIDAMRRRKAVGGIQFSQIDRAHLKDVVAGLTAWHHLLTLNYQRQTDDIAEELGNVADFLDLRVNRQTIRIQSSPVEDFVYISATLNFPIDCCPIPTFGSAMGSTVHFVVSRNKKEPDQLGSFLKHHGLQHRPVFLLYLQEMGLNLRRKYQHYAARRKLSVLLIDLCLAFHLCGIRNRLPALFKIALPFSWSQPYLMKGENVPRETFVGREGEVQSIQDPDGSCIIFGGRQLGKSALLRHFYHEYNDPTNNRHIVYLDIDGLGMPPQTHDQMQAEFWRKIHRELGREGFMMEREISSRKGAKKVEDEVIEEILGILRDYPERRLYLLLDETDSFLDKDSSLNFPIVRRIRAMMAQTGRRFKIVLAGLQSVQRYKNWKNHPFAQLGTDIVVRPLKPQAAQRLILDPLHALGFIFEKKDLILRILSQANYHPGLIQIFCYRLVENLYNRWGNKTSRQIQRSIGLEDLQAIERNPEFIEDIRNRFDWTLDLDDRYKVLTYALVLTRNPTSSRTEREFMSIAREWWPQVFEKMDQQALRAVLDEMEGLGVLVREDEDHTRMYRLRSPNLLRLLGTRQQIEDELQRIISKDDTTTINARNFHPLIGKRPVSFGPMTKEQEGQIANALNEVFGITTITGGIALGIDCLPEQIAEIFLEGEKWEEMIIPAQYAAIPNKIVDFIKNGLTPRKRSHFYTILDISLFPRESNISDFLNQLLEQLGGVCTKKSRGHVFVLTCPEATWRWLNEDKREIIVQHRRVFAIELQRWSNGAITNALENAGRLAGAKALGEEIFEKTLGWHKLVNSGLQALPSGTSGKTKDDILAIWDRQLDSLRAALADTPDVIMKEYGLFVDNQELNRAIRKLFEWSFADGGMMLNRDIVDCVREEEVELKNLFEDNGLMILEWMRMHGIILSEGSGQWRINRIVAEIMKNGNLQ